MHPIVCSIDKSKRIGLGPLGGEDSDAKMVHPQFSESSSSNCVSTGMQEEPLPWRSLPNDILEQVLAFLPLQDVFQMCCVCKRWNALIHSAQFQCRLAWGPFYSHRVRRDETRLCAVSWSLYDLGERKWIPMPLIEFPLQNPQSRWSLMATNGGLVCFGDGLQILVCNPLTNKWRELPSWRLNPRIQAIQAICYMIVDKERSSYKILFAGNRIYKCSDPSYGTVDVYDSMTKRWSICQSMSVGSIMKRGAYCSGEFYVLTWNCQRGLYAVEVLDLTTLRWREESIPISEVFRHYPFIVTCLGWIYLVGGRTDTQSYPLTSIVISQLDQSNRWTELSEYSKHFLGCPGEIHGCGSNGSKIFVVVNSGGMWVAVYDLATSCWEEPIHKSDVLNSQDIFETNFNFQPNFQVAP